MKMALASLIFLLTLWTTASAEWNIELAAKDASGELRGSLFGNPFEFGKAKWNSHCITIESSNKIGNTHAGKLFIFVKPEDETRIWEIDLDSGFKSPHVHVHFATESGKSATMMYTQMYTMHLEVTNETEESAAFRLHISLPDYKHSYLIGEFTAEKSLKN